MSESQIKYDDFWRTLKAKWNIILSAISIIGFLVCFIIPPLRDPKNYGIFAFFIANAIIWTLIEIKIKLSEDGLKKIFTNFHEAKSEIEKTILGQMKKNRKSALEIKIISGQAREIYPFFRSILDRINAEDIAISNVSFELYCINPKFLSSVNHSKLYNENFSYKSYINRVNNYQEEIKNIESQINGYNKDNYFEKHNIKVNLILYNTFPSFWGFLIGDKNLFWGNFSWKTDTKEFVGSLNLCNYVTLDTEKNFKEYYTLLKSEISFLKDSMSISVNMLEENVIYDHRQVSAINKVAYDNLLDEYITKKENYKNYSTNLDENKNQIEWLSDYLTNKIQKISKDAKVLEIGPGVGYLTELLSQKGFTIDCIEISQAMVNYLKSILKKVNIINDDFTKYEFKGLMYNCVIAVSFIHLYPSNFTLNLLKKINKILVPNGIAYISTSLHNISSEGYKNKSETDKFIVRYRKEFTKDELELFIEKSGFEIIETYEKIDFLNPAKTWMAYLVKKK